VSPGSKHQKYERGVPRYDIQQRDATLKYSYKPILTGAPASGNGTNEQITPTMEESPRWNHERTEVSLASTITNERYTVSFHWYSNKQNYTNDGGVS
jgi:hypothetical protein